MAFKNRYLIVLAIGFSAILASPSNVFHELKSPPPDWIFSRNANPSYYNPILSQRKSLTAVADVLKLRVSVKQQNVHVLEQLVLDMSTPDHPSYGNHMGRQEVLDLIRPKQDSTQIVIEWIQSYNVSETEDDGNWVSFLIAVETANKMLNTKFSWFTHLPSGRQSLRTLSYSVPPQVAKQIDFIQPTTKFSAIEAMRSTLLKPDADSEATALNAYAEYAAKYPPGSGSAVAPPDEVCNHTITPQCLLKLYNVHYPANPENGAKLSIGSFLDEYARYSDLDLFTKNVAPYAEGSSFNVVSINGGLNDQNSTADADEANMDLQYILGVGYPVPVTQFSTAGQGSEQATPAQPEPSGDNEPYIEFLAALLAMPDDVLPQTLSMSYGEQEQSWPEAEARKVCNGFMQLGARGVSIMSSSGDGGPGGNCEKINHENAFNTIFPGSCPYVTSVGATDSIPETTANFSGGGFSRYFPRLPFQAPHIDTWFANNKHPEFNQYFNISGSGTPDVSAQGRQFVVYSSGKAHLFKGTSASTPAFAGIVGLLNSARIQSGQKPLGYLNPLLYTQGFAAFNDITTGSTRGCNRTSADGGGRIPGAGFAATCGWDPATGLGTPNFGKLLALVAPRECNIGGILNNPNATAECSYEENLKLRDALLANATLCPIPGNDTTMSP